MGLITFLKNIKFLTKYKLSEIKEDSLIAKFGLDFLKYETKEDLETLYVPKILSSHETVNLILEKKLSVSRFGDGEILIMKDKSIAFQNKNPKLKERLFEILASSDENILIGLPYGMCHTTRNSIPHHKNYTRMFWGENADWVLNTVDKKRTFANTCFTVLLGAEENYIHTMQIWKDRDIALICGERVLKNIKHNIFSCAGSIEYIPCPTENAFDDYENILNRAKQIDKNKLVCIILGPTATVLAYDLAKLGYQALDLGHIAKSYDAHLKGEKRDSNFYKKFFGKD